MHHGYNYGYPAAARGVDIRRGDEATLLPGAGEAVALRR
jgi:hypothetical protein